MRSRALLTRRQFFSSTVAGIAAVTIVPRRAVANRFVNPPYRSGWTL